MPELPEVETIARELKNSICGAIIINAEKFRDKIRNLIPSDICKKIINQKIDSIERMAKYLILNLSNEYSLIFHLGMSGKILIYDSCPPLAKHDHFRIVFDNNKILHFNDPRRFGLIDLCKKSELKEYKLFKDLGFEPFDDFDSKILFKKLESKKVPIKKAIMDNKIIVGIGNIYAAEILYLCSVNPMIPANQISFDKLQEIIIVIRSVLNNAIKSGGSTLRDYASSSGKPGSFQLGFKVYGRESQSCYKCNTSIVRISQGGRSSFYCPTCQG